MKRDWTIMFTTWHGTWYKNYQIIVRASDFLLQKKDVIC